jgi:DNA-binding MarR family transcriptional regulator
MAAPDEDTLTDLPPSPKLVYKLLEYNGAMTHQELAEESMLATRTVRDAVNRLNEVGVVSEYVHLRDARQKLYGLSEAGEAASETSAAVSDG